MPTAAERNALRAERILPALLAPALLATLTTVSNLAADLALNWPHLLEPLLDFASTWVEQFVVAGAMLAVIARLYGRVPEQPPGRRLALARLVMWSALCGAAVHLLLAAGLGFWRGDRKSVV